MRRFKGKSDVVVRCSKLDEDFTVDGPELIGAWLEHLHDDVRSLQWRRELVVVLVALDEAEH